MNVTDFVNLVINSLKVSGKGTGSIKDNGDGTQSAIILTFKKPVSGDVFDFGNGNTSDINDVKPQTKPSENETKTENEEKPTHIVSLEDVNTNYYENSIKEQAKEEAQKETENNKTNNSSSQSWFGSILDMMTNLINSIIEMITGKAKT